MKILKKFLKIIVAVLIVMLVLLLTKDAMIKASIEKGITVITGLRLNIQSLDVGITSPVIAVKNLRLFNPAGYKDRIMADISEIRIGYDLKGIFRGKIHLKDLRLNLREFVVVRNKKGELNLNSLKAVRVQKKDVKLAERKKTKRSELQIDNLELKVERVVFKDYSKGVKPSIQEYNININEKYENIDDPYKFVTLIVVKALRRTKVANLTGFDLKSLQSTISGTMTKAQEAVMTTAETLTRSLGFTLRDKKKKQE